MKKIKNCLVFLIIINLLTLWLINIWSGIINRNKSYYYPFNTFQKIEKAITFSKNKKNIIYIMVDMVTGFDVTSVLQNNKEIEDNFTSFTNYQNVTTINRGTNGSVPNIFGGYDYNVYYKNHWQFKNIKFRDYMKKAMKVLISAFSEGNWDITCIGNQYYDYDENKSYWDSNWETLESDFINEHVKAINAPDICRYVFYKKNRLYQQLQLPKNIFLESTNANYLPIVPYLQYAPVIKTNKNKFITIMDESVHTPIIMNKMGNYYFPKNENRTLQTYSAVEGFLRKISNFIIHLKEKNIYDNTMIIINSDHGSSADSSLPIIDNKFNKSNIDYSSISKLNDKYPGFIRSFPTLLVKPFNDFQFKSSNKIIYDNNFLYTNADALSFIKNYNKEINFNLLDQTKDKRYLKKLDDIFNRKNIYIPQYNHDTWWNDKYYKYLSPPKTMNGKSFLVKNSIYDINNYLISKYSDDYYDPDDLDKWTNIS